MPGSILSGPSLSEKSSLHMSLGQSAHSLASQSPSSLSIFYETQICNGVRHQKYFCTWHFTQRNNEVVYPSIFFRHVEGRSDLIFNVGTFWLSWGGRRLENLHRPPLHLRATKLQISEIWALCPSIDKLGSTKKNPTNKFSREFSGSSWNSWNNWVDPR